MHFSFFKYSGTGNDFVVLDNRDEKLTIEDPKVWEKICDRKNGIGADGVLLLEKSQKHDFRMRYLNADGGEVEMCGNGARVITDFAHNELSLHPEIEYEFETMNGVYKAYIDKEYGIRLLMTELFDVDKIDISDLSASGKHLYLNTGVPHCIFEVPDVDHVDLQESGALIRYDKRFEKGVNANFFHVEKDGVIKLRTYERGVEGETLACGTGATAAAIACSKLYGWKDRVEVKMPGGSLHILFNDNLSEVYLCGKTEKIFSGSFSL